MKKNRNTVATFIGFINPAVDSVTIVVINVIAVDVVDVVATFVGFINPAVDSVAIIVINVSAIVVIEVVVVVVDNISVVVEVVAVVDVAVVVVDNVVIIVIYNVAVVIVVFVAVAVDVVVVVVVVGLGSLSTLLWLSSTLSSVEKLARLMRCSENPGQKELTGYLLRTRPKSIAWLLGMLLVFIIIARLDVLYTLSVTLLAMELGWDHVGLPT